jgi:hypothetical protein
MHTYKVFILSDIENIFPENFLKIDFGKKKRIITFARPYRMVHSGGQSFKKKREHSSAGSEHLPYKQRVRGSNPCAPTTTK